MLGVLGFVLVWLLAWGRNWSKRRVLTVMALWWGLLLLVHAPRVGLPNAPKVFGGDLHFWAVLGGLVVLLLGYRRLLRAIRQRGQAALEVPEESGPFRKAEIDLYARHLMLQQIGGPGQKKLKSAKVLVVGAGGLGAPALMYLAGSGVGVIGVIDDDQVEASNLQRQIIHTEASIGQPKVFSAEARIRALNPFVEVRPYHRKLDQDVAATLIADYDLVLDGSDNFETRYLLNRTCAALGKPLIMGALTQWEGQVALYDPNQNHGCYECVFPVQPAADLVPSCALAGVVAPLPGVIGSLMALEAVKYITGAGETLAGRLLIYDGLYAQSRIIKLKARKDCPACGES